MFASLKNKIREETGSDLSKLTSKITSSTAQRIDSLRGRSHQGSTSSITSVISSDGARDEPSIDICRSEEDYKRRYTKLEQEFAKRLEDKEREYQDVISERDRRIHNVERQRDDVQYQIQNLKDALKSAESKLTKFCYFYILIHP